jgi:hypothetical protein
VRLNNLRLDKRKKTLILAGAALLFLGLLYRLMPLLSLGEIKDDISIKQRKLVKYREALREKKDLQTRLISLNRVMNRLEAGFLSGSTPALAAVDIQNLLNDIAGRSNIDIKSMRVLKPKSDYEEYTIVSVELTINANVKQLKELLYRIENSPKYLVAERVRIRALKAPQSDELRSTLTVAGLMKKTEA